MQTLHHPGDVAVPSRRASGKRRAASGMGSLQKALGLHACWGRAAASLTAYTARSLEPLHQCQGCASARAPSCCSFNPPLRYAAAAYHQYRDLNPWRPRTAAPSVRACASISSNTIQTSADSSSSGSNSNSSGGGRSSKHSSTSSSSTAGSTAHRAGGVHSVLESPYLTGAPMTSKGYGSAPPPQPGDYPLWAHEVLPALVPPQRRIYCNRALNMKQIKAFGFDMDYTLAQYRPETFEALAHSQTVDKLVRVFGYPEVLRTFTFSWDYMTKGLIIDKARGNVLKVDRHKYVKLAYHGFTPLSADDRKAVYNANYQGLNFDSDEFALVDTLFSLAEAYLYCQLVELKDSQQGEGLKAKSYLQLYKDLRTAVDMCHRDGSLKKAVAANPAKYIHYDPLLKHMLGVARSGGRRVFLATNSLWDYTNVVMNYLLEGKTGSAKTTDWLKCFDVVIVGCGKPAFFGNSGQLFHVDVKTGLLSNTDNGAPILPVDEADLADLPPDTTLSPTPTLQQVAGAGDGGGGSSGSGGSTTSFAAANVFQGGCYRDLHRMLGATSGEQVLYVGDHIYGDIVKAKKAIGWRTMLVVPELDTELGLQERTKGVQAELRLLRQQRDALEDQIQRYEWALARDVSSLPPPGTEEHEKNVVMLEELRARQASLRERHSSLLHDLHAQHHPIWGQILKTGYQNSRFAHQIERFACLYTSHVSNLAYVSPDKKWQGRLDIMAHEDPCLGDSMLMVEEEEGEDSMHH